VVQKETLQEKKADGGHHHDTTTMDHSRKEVDELKKEPEPRETTADSGGKDGGVQDGVPMPDVDSGLLTPRKRSNRTFTSLHFSGAQNCSLCHDGLKDSKGTDVSIVKSWSATMMANASRDPFWLAKFRSEVARAPHLSELVQDKCTKCHAPMAYHELKTSKKKVQVFGAGGLLDSSNQLYNHAMGGVSCTVCHQIPDSPKLGTLAGFSGNYNLPVYTIATQQKVLYGPYTNPFPNPMVMHTGFTPKHSSHIRSSKLCGSCHNLKTPFVDKDGKVVPKTPTAEFPEQMIFSEWKHSDYADGRKTPRSCQNCHMKQTSGVKISTRPMNNRIGPRSPFGQHIFVGGNTFMLTLLRDYNKLLGVTSTNFAFTLQKTREMLQSAATVRIESPSLQGGELKFQLLVQNQSGHKLPTGFPSRRVFLHVQVKDAQGRMVFESGKPRADGSIVGVDADRDGKRYEPHYDEITKPDQVQVYEAIMGNTDKKLTYTLLRAASYLKDNRLLPHGFDKKTAPSDIKVAGKASSDADFTGGRDVVKYRIKGLSSGAYTVKATLYLQSVGYRFAQDLFRDNKHREVLLFQYLWNKATFHVEPITTTQTTIRP
jgi:hypothetical protein